METGMYVVFSGGGVDYEPEFYGVFYNLDLAKACVKKEILKFLKEVLLPESEVFADPQLNDSPVIDKVVNGDYTYFYAYSDNENVKIGDYCNVFVLHKVK